MPDFVHLHVHSEFSLLDGACRISEMAGVAKSLGQTALALTDHGVMYGSVDFYRAATAAGIKPITGCEVYVAPRTRFDMQHELDSDTSHLVLLCQNEIGYKNLIKLVSLAFTEGFYSKPRIDDDLLSAHCEGLICLSACASGAIPKLILRGNYTGALEKALKYRDMFGEDNFYLEVQDHGIEDQKVINRGLLRLHNETGIPLVATNDAHYCRREDAYIQDVLLCIQTGKTLDSEDRIKFSGDEFYLKSGDEMAELFKGYPDAIENTVKIAERCSFDYKFGEYHLPRYRLPQSETDSAAYLRRLCLKGFAERYPNTAEGKPPEGYMARLEYELSTIERMGFVDYFLIVWDFIAFARSHDIPVGPGRGSGAGSMAAYCLYITDIDPIRYSLYFERFLNPERVSMPDFDIDFCPNRRQEVIDYVVEKYGKDHVAQIVTFGTMAARGSIRDVARVMGISYAEADTVAKLIPFSPGMTVDGALKISPQLSELYRNDARIKKLLDTARSLEGIPRHASTHAAGVVITQLPVSDYVPLAVNGESVVTQVTMVTLEELGLLKMDFLGLRNLTVIDSAARMAKRRDPEFDINKIDLNDDDTYKMLASGDTLGVFQLESAGMTSVVTGLLPHSIEEITAVVALYRPGPMDSIPKYIESKHHPERVTYRHPLLKDILDVTYGCIVYQEQVMDVFRKLAGFSLGRADIVRRAMSKKKMKELQKERENFLHGNPEENIAGCAANGVPEDVANALFDEMLDFASYAFNKPHAAAYAVVSYQTAFLKCHYPREFMAALLTSVLDNTAKVAEYIAECRHRGIQVLPPDINESDDGFTVVGDNIRFGLVAVKNIGRKFILSMMVERESGGPYTSLQNFCERTLDLDLNRRALESLIKCGAFDQFGKRRQLLEIAARLLETVAASRSRVMDGQIDLFGMTGAGPSELPLPDVEEYPQKELSAMEKESTGLYLTGHPLDSYRTLLAGMNITSVARILEAGDPEMTALTDNQRVKTAVIVNKIRLRTTKSNAMMAYIEVEDDGASAEFIVFPKTLDKYTYILKEDTPLIVEGKLSLREDRPPQVVCESFTPLVGIEAVQNRDGGVKPAAAEQISEPSLPAASKAAERTIWLAFDSAETPVLKKVKPMLSMFPGSVKFKLYYRDTGRTEGCLAACDERLMKRLHELLGEEAVVSKSS